MAAEMSVWSHVMQWIGYVSWCASTSDTTCRPFVGFLALSGAAAGMSTLLLLALTRMLHAWEHDVVAARAARRGALPAVAARPAAEPPAAEPPPRIIDGPVPSLPRAEPALGLGITSPAYPAHAEPLLLKTQ